VKTGRDSEKQVRRQRDLYEKELVPDWKVTKGEEGGGTDQEGFFKHDGRQGGS